MTDHLLVAFTNPTEGMVEQCTSWYRDVHLAEALTAPGFEAAHLLVRDEQLPESTKAPSRHRFLAAYAISSTPEELVRTTGRHLAEGYRPPPFLARDGAGPWIYTAIGDRVGSSAAGEHLVIALSNAIDDRDDEFNDWYDVTHVPEVLALPGFESARRFRIDEVQMPPKVAKPSEHRYLAVYEFSGVSAAARDLLLTHRFTRCDAVDPSTTRTLLYTSIARRGSLPAAA
jgi:hypothetical protein